MDLFHCYPALYPDGTTQKSKKVDRQRYTYLLKLNRSLSNTKTGPVLLKMVSGWPAKRQKMAPETAVPRKLSNTP